MDYSRMAGYYDQIMTSGYYDYVAIVDDLLRFDARNILEVGVGTGLVLEPLASRRPDVAICGVDLTQAMLDIAGDRLSPHPQVTLHCQNVVDLSLGSKTYDLAFSYGGVWYWVHDGDTFCLISHLRGEDDNRRGFERVAAHLDTGGTLLLGIQPQHSGYTKTISEGLAYTQHVEPIPDGFRKNYFVASPDGTTLMEQVTDYRTYPFADAIDLLDKHGFDQVADSRASIFLEFVKR